MIVRFFLRFLKHSFKKFKVFRSRVGKIPPAKKKGLLNKNLQNTFKKKCTVLKQLINCIENKIEIKFLN